MGFPVTFLSWSLVSHTKRASISSQDWFALKTLLLWRDRGTVAPTSRGMCRRQQKEMKVCWLTPRTTWNQTGGRKHYLCVLRPWAGAGVPLSGAGNDRYTEINDSLRKRSATLDVPESICGECASHDMQQWPLADDSFWGHPQSPFLETIALRAFSRDISPWGEWISAEMGWRGHR